LPTISHSPKPWILSPQQTPPQTPGHAARSSQPPAESYPKRLAGGYLFLLALCLIPSGCAPPAIAQPEPLVIWEVDEVREPVHHTDYVIEYKTKKEYIVLEIYPWPPLEKTWDSLVQLKAWRDEKIKLLRNWNTKGWHCGDYMEWWEWQAELDDKYLPRDPIVRGNYGGIYVSPYRVGGHFGNSATLANDDIYYCESMYPWIITKIGVRGRGE